MLELNGSRLVRNYRVPDSQYPLKSRANLLGAIWRHMHPENWFDDLGATNGPTDARHFR
jgi:hypothetical protein